MIIIHYLKVMNCLWINIQLKIFFNISLCMCLLQCFAALEIFFNLGLDIYIDLRSGIDTLFK